MSTRETTLAALKTAFEYITTTYGFASDVQEVLRKFVWPDPDRNLPILMVLGGSEVYDEDMGDDTNVEMRVIVRGYTQDHSNPETALNNLIADVLKLIDDATYKPGDIQIQPVRTDTDEGWLNDVHDGMAMFDMECKVIYRYARSSP